jgi:transcriptional antiterminator RfaH
MKRWYVIRSKHRNEDFLCQQLHHWDIEAYYPCIHSQPIKSPTRKIKPYFPSYLFVHVQLDAVGVSFFQWIPGAIGLVCFGGEPAWVSDGMLQAIRRRVARIDALGGEPAQDLKTGDDIIVHSGPLAGYHGIFAAYLTDRERAIVFLNFIRGQQARVDLPVTQIKSINHCRP